MREMMRRMLCLLVLMLCCASGCVMANQLQPRPPPPDLRSTTSVTGAYPGVHGVFVSPDVLPGSRAVNPGLHPGAGVDYTPCPGPRKNGDNCIPTPPVIQQSSDGAPSHGVPGVGVPGVGVPGVGVRPPGVPSPATAADKLGFQPGPAIAGVPGMIGSHSVALRSTPDAGVGGLSGVGVHLEPGKNVAPFNPSATEVESPPSEAVFEGRKFSEDAKGVRAVPTAPGFPVNASVRSGGPANSGTREKPLLPGVPVDVPSFRGGNINEATPAVPGGVAPSPATLGSHPGAGAGVPNVPSGVSRDEPNDQGFPGVPKAMLNVGGVPPTDVGFPTVAGIRGSKSKEQKPSTTNTQGTGDTQQENTEASSPTIEVSASGSPNVQTSSQTSSSPAQSESTRVTSNTPIKEKLPAITPPIPPLPARSETKQPKKRKADSSSISSVWVRVPLLIVAVLFSATVY
ncbi:uncharacterized protein TM35_000451020 [Trypanosoma theileri]|uniref:Uncharacterized protein n=1 Tax=Trypanosoma theileri TaxID=67003 RepID=A0A1X0NHX5_9TRYP|nr:uncharacterized protein TM35_000451020 [Trypanosoma theileri]ORC84364.1 hypothetical protein TM35_000451020 [Trypanosoma theileri]